MLDRIRSIEGGQTRRTALGDDFLAWLAYLVHEVRSPLTGLTSGLLVIRAEQLTNGQVEACERMQRQVDQLVRLTNDLSQYASNNLELITDKFEFSEVWSDVRENTMPALSERRQVLKERVPEVRIPMVADRQRLAQVFANIVLNASKYSPEGAEMEVEVTVDRDRLKFQLQDRGIGIPADELPHIFEMFYRGTAQERGGNAHGSGLGLAITRRFVELHGGSIEAKSDGVGKGARFTVQLPVCAAVCLA